MKTRLVNGYNVTGNHGEGSDRKYHVCNAAGDVLSRHAGSVRIAVQAAEALPPGDVMPEPEPVAEVTNPTPEPATDVPGFMRARESNR